MKKLVTNDNSIFKIVEISHKSVGIISGLYNI